MKKIINYFNFSRSKSIRLNQALWEGDLTKEENKFLDN